MKIHILMIGICNCVLIIMFGLLILEQNKQNTELIIQELNPPVIQQDTNWKEKYNECNDKYLEIKSLLDSVVQKDVDSILNN